MAIDQFSDIAGLDDLIHFVDRYCMEFMTPDCKFDAAFQTAIDLSYEFLLRLSSDEASAYSFKLHAYCIYLRKELDKNLAKQQWCEEILHRIVGQNWTNFSDYMKYEPKRQAIIADDTFAVKVEKMLMYLSAASQQAQYKVESVKKMADILENIGKKKAFSER